MQTNIAFERANAEVMAAARGGVAVQPSDAELHQKIIIRTAIMTSAVSIYPIFIGFYLSRRKITDEVADWV